MTTDTEPMIEVMPPIDLEAIDARVAAATAGPWKAHHYFHDVSPDGETPGTTELDDDDCEDAHEHSIQTADAVQGAGVELAHIPGPAPADAIFIAHAREDVPLLVQEVRRLRLVVERLLAPRTDP